MERPSTPYHHFVGDVSEMVNLLFSALPLFYSSVVISGILNLRQTYHSIACFTVKHLKFCGIARKPDN